MHPGQPATLLQYEPLSACAGLAHAFLLRDPVTDLNVAKQEAIQRLNRTYREGVESLGFSWRSLQTAEQVHGAELAVVTEALGGLVPVPGVDGLLTIQPGILLGIMVADCCAVSVVDPVRRALGLLHSGKKGTGADITGKAIKRMASEFGTRPEDLIVHLSPCIRPPHYEVDFAATIRSQAAGAGVPERQIHDEGLCTASDPCRFYSYRQENGLTGRMLALLGYHPSAP